MTDRNALLQEMADHYERRAEEIEKVARSVGNDQTRWQLKAQAMAFREAAAYAHQQKEQ